MADSFGERIHAPTPRRRQQAREEGRVARSQDLVSAALLLGSLLALHASSDAIGEWFNRFADEQLSGSAWIHATDWSRTDPTSTIELLRGLVGEVSGLLLPFLAVLLLAVIVANLGQFGWVLAPKRIAFNFRHVSPLNGLQRLFSQSSFVRFGFGILNAAVVVLVVLWSLWSRREQVLATTSATPGEFSLTLVALFFSTALKVAIALTVLALLDYLYQRWKHEQELRMTHEELREEMKAVHGDPQMLARRRQVQKQIVMSRLTASLEQANVVLTSGTHLAIALQFDRRTMETPRVITKGAGGLAQEIRRLAEARKIPLIDQVELTRELYQQVTVDEPIPPTHYEDAARVLRELDS